MLELVVPERELFNEENDTFIVVPGFTLRLEHSLVSLSKWESRFEKPFLNGKDKSREEVLGYIEAMVIGESPPDFLPRLDSNHLDRVNEYINAKMTATTFHERGPKQRGTPEIITAELIYYWMIAYQINWEAQHWHLERLLTLVRVCNIKNQPPKKMSQKDAAVERRRLNAERRAKHGTRG